PLSATLDGLTVLELTSTDHPGLISEVFAVLADLRCTVVEAKVWTHNGRLAAHIFIRDEDSGSSIDDPQQIHRVEARLRHVLKGDHDIHGAKTATVPLPSLTHSDRRLHQLMFADHDYERISSPETTFSSSTSSSQPSVSVQHWTEHEYSIVNRIAIGAAHNGPMRPSRRCDPEIPGDGLSMMRIEVSTKGQMVMNVFYVTDAVGHLADPKMIDVVIEKIGVESLKVNDDRP
uniref:ACT domain-containing protein ACR n=1 Tax=Elaeis guineensis var. tenera TaxID=51953 RepID=A0A6I9S2A2_ELAGV